MFDARWQMTFSLTLVLVLTNFAVWFNVLVDGWSIGDSWYWAIMTLFSVGTHDMTPKSSYSRAFLTVFMFLAVLFMAWFLHAVHQSCSKSMLSEFGEVAYDTRYEEQQHMSEAAEGAGTEAAEDDSAGKPLLAEA